jgi:thiol:disulfide interchange protein
MTLTRPLIGFLTLTLFVSFASASSSIAQTADSRQPTDYFTAYKNAQSGNKPMLVLVTAEWCPPCQVMKATTIPQLMQRNAFSQFNYATVDLDEEERLARQLIGDRGVPQLIMFEKQNGEWVRRYLRGIQTAETVEAFVAQADYFRTANATASLDK